MTLLPWLLFVLVMGIFLFGQKSSAATAWLAFLMCGLIAVVFVAVGNFARNGAFMVLGTLCLMCTIVGAFLGQLGWNFSMRQWYWMGTGFNYANVTGLTPAEAVSDAATIQFWNPGKNKVTALVDGTRVAGYAQSNFYCVAPILSKAQAANDVIRVEFWAVGVNCCTKRGDFICDDAGLADTSYAVNSPMGGDPCPDGSTEYFRKAITEAEAAYDLVSAPGALMVRWINDPTVFKNSLLHNALIYYAIAAGITLIITILVGCFALIRGVGSFRQSSPTLSVQQGTVRQRNYDSVRAAPLAQTRIGGARTSVPQDQIVEGAQP